MDPNEHENGNGNGNGNEDLMPPPPPPPIVPADVEPVKVDLLDLPPEPVKKKLPTRLPIARKGLGSKGTKLPLLTNHFKVTVANSDGHFFQYSVCFSFSVPVFYCHTCVFLVTYHSDLCI